MQVIDRLVGIGSLVDYEPVAGLVDAAFNCQSSGDERHMADERFASLIEAAQEHDVVGWDDDQMNRRERIDILERDDLIVPVVSGTGDFAQHDFAEDAVGFSCHRVPFGCRILGWALEAKEGGKRLAMVLRITESDLRRGGAA